MGLAHELRGRGPGNSPEPRPVALLLSPVRGFASLAASAPAKAASYLEEREGATKH